MSSRRAILTPRLLLRGTGATVAVLLLGAILLMLGGANPLLSFGVMLQGAFGSWQGFGETLLRFAPLTLIAIGLVPSLRLGLFNIGAPGQIGMGALFATLVSLHLSFLPTLPLLILAGLAGALGGAVCAYIPALVRARLNVNEILSTLVFNFITVLLLQFLLTGPLKGHRANLPQSDAVPEVAWLPLLSDGSRGHYGVILVLAAAVALLLFERGPAGYRLRLLGASPSLARQAGARETPAIIWTICLGGAFAGLAGWIQVAGVDHRLYASVADPIGHTGLFAALLGGLTPLGILASGLLFSALLRGGDSLQIGAGVSPEIINALVGLTLLVVSVQFTRLRRAGTPT